MTTIERINLLESLAKKIDSDRDSISYIEHDRFYWASHPMERDRTLELKRKILAAKIRRFNNLLDRTKIVFGNAVDDSFDSVSLEDCKITKIR